MAKPNDTREPERSSKFERHFFVCMMERPATGKPSCSVGGAPEVYAALQEGLGAHPELWDKVSITTTGCLGPCFEGPNIVVYPEAVWYCGVKPADVAEIVESHMVGGTPVERLRFDWPDDE